MIYMIRHGQTERNRHQVLQGRTDAPLNTTCVAQAAAVAEKFASARIQFDIVYSSPLRRAIQTAEIIAPGKAVHVDPRLTEMDYGPYEGMDLNTPSPEVATFFMDFANTPAPDGMEQLSSVIERTGAFLEDLCHTDRSILISTHAIALKGLLEYLSPDSHGSYWSKHIHNCDVFVTQYRHCAFTVPVPLTFPVI